MHPFHLAPNAPETYLGIVSDAADAKTRASQHADGTLPPTTDPIPKHRRGRATWFNVDSGSVKEAEYVLIEPREDPVPVVLIPPPKVVPRGPYAPRGWKARNSIGA